MDLCRLLHTIEKVRRLGCSGPSTIWSPPQLDQQLDPVAQPRRPIKAPADYGVPLPEWLQRCIEQVPPGSGDSCPTDGEALLAAAFDFAYQLHDGQFRATGEPYIIHPIAVADLLRDIARVRG